jgi:cholesterol transport system auxiliary component
VIRRVALSALFVSGCALFSRGEALSVRYFDPEPPPRSPAAARSSVEAGFEEGDGAPRCALSLGRVAASDDIDTRIAFRPSPYRMDYYETRRWSERPDGYLRRSLVRALFEERACRRIASGPGPSLDVDLVGFEERRGAPETVRVALHLLLHDGATVLWESSIEVVRAAPGAAGGEPFEPVVAALAGALGAAVAEVAEQVGAALRAGADGEGARRGPP